MFEIIFSFETINVMADAAGCLLSALLIVFLAAKRRTDDTERLLLLGALLLLAGLTGSLVVRTFILVGQNGDIAAFSDLDSKLIQALDYILVFSSVSAFFLCSVRLGEIKDRKYKSHAKLAFYGACIILGIAIFFITGSSATLSIFITIQLVTGLICCVTSREFAFNKAIFTGLVCNSIVLFVIYIIWHNIRLQAIGLVVMYIMLYAEYINYVEKLYVEKERELVSARLDLLMGQIYPHFVFNTLQTIKGLCNTDPVRAGEALDLFSLYLRSNLESLTTREMIPFADELEHARAYLELEELAGSRGINVEYKLETTDFLVPSLILQPVVENAVKHGGSQGEEIQIVIETFMNVSDIYIKVTNASLHADQGEKLTSLTKADNIVKKRSVGLENVRTRLSTQCGGSLEINPTNGGTEVLIKIPIQG